MFKSHIRTQLLFSELFNVNLDGLGRFPPSLLVLPWVLLLPLALFPCVEICKLGGMCMWASVLWSVLCTPMVLHKY